MRKIYILVGIWILLGVLLSVVSLAFSGSTSNYNWTVQVASTVYNDSSIATSNQFESTGNKSSTLCVGFYCFLQQGITNRTDEGVVETPSPPTGGGTGGGGFSFTCDEGLVPIRVDGEYTCIQSPGIQSVTGVLAVICVVFLFLLLLVFRRSKKEAIRNATTTEVDKSVPSRSDN